MLANPTVAVLHIRTSRPHDPEFQRKLDEMTDSALAAIAAHGWATQLVATAEAPADDVLAIARDADAVLVMGGEDVEPALYGGLTEYPGSGTHEPEADRVTMQVMRDAVEHGRPLLAICRGLQQLNVALGGTLHEHITGHTVKTGDTFVVTPVEALAETGIAVIGAKGPVMCSHHQSIRRLGDGLRVTVRAADGTVEAVEHETAPVAAVQWHPEHPSVAADQLVPLLQHMLDRAGVLVD